MLAVGLIIFVGATFNLCWPGTLHSASVGAVSLILGVLGYLLSVPLIVRAAKSHPNKSLVARVCFEAFVVTLSGAGAIMAVVYLIHDHLPGMLTTVMMILAIVLIPAAIGFSVLVGIGIAALVRSYGVHAPIPTLLKGR